MNLESLKHSIKVFEFASYELEQISNKGLNNLSKIRKPENVIKLKHLNNSDFSGINTLLAAQRIPSLVLLSFSIELTLKLILIQKFNIKCKSHDLFKLYKKLPPEIKSDLVKIICSELNISEIEFSAFLKENNSTFVEWRYFHENLKPNTANVQFLKLLHKHLKSFIL